MEAGLLQPQICRKSTLVHFSPHYNSFDQVFELSESNGQLPFSGWEASWNGRVCPRSVLHCYETEEKHAFVNLRIMAGWQKKVCPPLKAG